MLMNPSGRRGSAPGERRGGRRKGTPNRATMLVRERLAELGCDPVAGLAAIAMDEANGLELRARCYSDLLSFSAPKPKSIELAGADAGPQKIVVRWLPSTG